MTRYFVHGPLGAPHATLMRRDDNRDMAFRQGRWVDTQKILEWSVGGSALFELKEISEGVARHHFPKAFRSPS